MKILISGASGLIGSYLSKRYIEDGHEVIALTRNPKKVSSSIDFSDIVKFDYKSDILPKFLKILLL